MVVNKTIITVTMTIAGTVADFDDAKQTTFKDGLRAEICNNAACPGVSIALTIAPGSVVVTSEISYREDDASIGASVQTKAEALADARGHGGVRSYGHGGEERSGAPRPP